MIKRFLILTAFFFGGILGWSQDLSGDWHGVLKVNGTELRNTFHFTQTADGWRGSLDIPQQEAKGLVVEKVVVGNDSLWLSMPDLGVTYTGKIESDPPFIKGVFKQNGFELPLNLTREAAAGPARPQTPEAPFPYKEEEVSITNSKIGIKLSGTLTLPKTDQLVPAVILIHGSGPHNRNEEVMEHHPFWVIADYLTRNGIAVLRYDKRGIAESEGNYGTATSYDFAEDVAAALEFLKQRKEIDSRKIGLVGHSEGGLIAPIVADEDSDVAFIVMLAGPAVDGGEILLQQERDLMTAYHYMDSVIEETISLNTKLFDAIRTYKEDKGLRDILWDILEKNWEEFQDPKKPAAMSKEEYFEMQIEQLTSAWLKEFIAINPQDYLSKIKIPLLALNGSLDLQVSAKQNLPMIEKALKKAGNKNYKIIELEGLNHLFQHAKTGALNEYAELEETIAPEVLEIIKDWILKL